MFDFSVDVIIPVRSRDDYDIIDRLKWKKYCNIPDNFDFLVVDYGSHKHQEIKGTCEELGFNYIYIDKPNNLFNLSECRNTGLKESSADFVIFEDVDLMHKEDFYESINVEIKNLIINQGWVFFAVPVTYLSEMSTELLVQGVSNEISSFLISEAYNSESPYIQHHAPTSSFVVCRRKDAIKVGGFDEAFEGWGFEDSDFAVRLLMLTESDKPRRFYRLDTRPYSNQVSWDGWRSLYRVYGDLIALKGIYSFHVWHPIAEHRSKLIRERNHKIFNENCSRYSSDKFVFTPLNDKNKKVQIFLSKNPHSWNQSVFDVFDNPLFIDETNITISSVSDIIEAYDIDCVVFTNPYGTVKRKIIYDEFKSHNIDCYVVERGALPWSIYIDKGGFCAESDSYSESNWINKKLSEQEVNNIHEYMNEIKTSGVALEPQSNMIGGDNLKRKLFGDDENVNVLFVALQSPSDTTTNYFCGGVESYQNFLLQIEKLPHLLPENWKVVVKNHPLSLEKFNADDIKIVDGYHINDIIAMSDNVALLNSGVGILSMIFNKFTYHFGQAFYSFDGLNKEVSTAEELVNEIRAGNIFDKEKAIKFIDFLVNDFYSFASWERKERSYTDKAKLSISKNIKYSKVNVFERGVSYGNYQEYKKLVTSYLFDRYRMDEYISRNPQKPAKVEIVNTKSVSNAKIANKSLSRRRYEKFKASPTGYMKTVFIKLPKKIKSVFS
ncbi:galactosyltransferase-related protein [Vibrio cholerae]|uniref:galactosyltransferase-related protein n=1 Tax=Vibrio cholerae TaxID=666 RepID=UPI002FE61005